MSESRKKQQLTPEDRRFLEEETNCLFDCDYFSPDFDPEGNEERQDRAEQFLESYRWKDVCAYWRKYLFDKCRAPKEAINYCHLFWAYCGVEHFISDPYDFLGYILSVVDIRVYWDKAGSFLDGFCIKVLEKTGKVSLWNDPYYQPWEDPEMIAAIEKHKQAGK